MTEVERLIGVWGRVLDHDERRRVGREHVAVVLVGIGSLNDTCPERVGESEVEEALDWLGLSDIGDVGDEVLADLGTSLLRFLMRYLEQWENDDGVVALLVFAGDGHLNGIWSHIGAVEALEGVCHSLL